MIRDEHQLIWLPAVLALGSNLGDREQTLRNAVGAIREIEGVRVVSASSIVETPALKLDGVDEEAPAYLNAVIEVLSALTPERLLDALHEIESDHGRIRAERWGDRTIDIDIVSFGGFVVDSDRLTLPHPRAWQRAFVLVPWLEIEPDARIPGRGPVAELLAETTDRVTPFAAEPLL